MRVLLVDDEELGLLRLKSAVNAALKGECELLCYTNPVIAFEENKTEKTDLAFLDIEMPVLNGISLAKKLKSVNPLINVIFVTAYNEYALDAYKIHATGYITKPVNSDKVKEELAGLRYLAEIKPTKKLQVKCFGNFEVFVNGEPLKFSRSKSKELFAYLIDREGAAININELNVILWEEDHKSYCRNLIADIIATLKNAGAEGVFIKRRNECYIDVDKIDCDAYEYKKNNPDAIRAYRGEYMSQYPWAIFEDKN